MNDFDQRSAKTIEFYIPLDWNVRIMIDVFFVVQQNILESLEEREDGDFLAVFATLHFHDGRHVRRPLQDELEQGGETETDKFLTLGNVDSVCKKEKKLKKNACTMYVTHFQSRDSRANQSQEN